jgi:wobble nucleotide-excising tRNase
MSFLDRVTKAVGDAVDRGKKEVDQFVAIQKINGQIGNVENRISESKVQIQQTTLKIGEMALEMLGTGTLVSLEMQILRDQITGIEQQIAAAEAEIAEKRAEIEKIKAEDKAANAPTTAAAEPPPPPPPPIPTSSAGRFCPQCGAAAGASGAFCGQCGAKLA